MPEHFLEPHQHVRGNYIGNGWQEPQAWMAATSPIDDSDLCRIPASGAHEVDRALAAAVAASGGMRRLSVWDRARLCRRIADRIEANREELARLVTIDQGKPLAEARAEIGKAIEGFANVAEMIKWLEGRLIPSEDPSKIVTSRYTAKGVQAVITPWNFPINIPVEYIAPGLAAGNAIVWIPAPSTSVCAARFMEVIAGADVPDGAVNLVIGRGAEAGAALVSDPRIDVVGFTGSSATGLAIARAAAGKSMLLELGGNGPVVVMDDADLERAAQGALSGAFFNGGQTCAATGRVLVHRRVHDRFVDLLVKGAETVRVGNPLEPATTMGPLNNTGVRDKVLAHLDDARQAQARIAFGGKPLNDLGSHYVEPAIVAGVGEDALLNREETFGPVVPVIAVEGLDEALRLTNDSPYGLSCAIYTSDLHRAHRFAEEARSGLVVVNDSSLYWELHIPFGGAAGTRSGLGRLGGADTIKALSDVRTTIVDHSG